MSFVVKLFSCLVLAPTIALAQADYVREKRWADEIVPALLVGEAVQLELPGGRKFLGIYASSNSSAPAVIVVHGAGVHPDWGLINALRSQLADQGYATLSVQMPVLSSEAGPDQYGPLYPEAAERIAAAVRFLRTRRHAKVGIVSHSLGARMTNYFIEHSTQPLDAWVSIGLSGGYTAADRFKAPVLDLYGERDFPAVRDNSAARADSLRRVRGSAQVEVPGADHFFAGQENILVGQVKLFLDQKLK
ncbi:MAG: dienelactone hydrolase family protein [Burkholderiales bacterium]